VKLGHQSLPLGRLPRNEPGKVPSAASPAMASLKKAWHI
jgi:hypothetical protein